ncbi:MAG: S8 family serine peptidase [Trueperaceae bacterium]|nr:S8 family serine peptidase [Trueperaceae bacterium]
MKWIRPFLLLTFALGACTQPAPQTLPVITIVVDPEVTPLAPSLPGFEDGEPRPLAGVTNEDGAIASFVANEVWLSTDNDAEVQTLVGRWNGKILRMLDPAKAGVTGLPKQYLIRIDASSADASKLSEDLRTLEQNSTGNHKVSSQAGLNLIAVTSREAVGGLNIGMNWVGSGGGAFTDQTSLEAPTGAELAGVPYTPNAFSWPSHDRFSEQDIGVAQAWRALDLADKLNNKIKLAVLDMGFQPDNDWPRGYQAINNVPGINPIGTENFFDCSGGNPCPWHGTNVVSAAMAVPDNNYGSAGPAGPVAEPIVVFTTGDFFLSISALLEARVLGARIANMSYGVPVPNYLAVTVLPFEGATAALRATGLLIFAAAGNDGQDVDAESCFILCIEDTWHAPCENAGVICVGGLKTNSKWRGANSNYGAKQVDIYAPFTLWLGPDPSAPDNKVRAKNGTSFSSPFAAGVAALIWAANPDLSANQVENILMETAHASPDSNVNRYVNALAAVQRALGNVPPSVTLSTAGGDVPLNRELSFNADVFDFEDAFPCCTTSWTSDVDGNLGSGRSVQHTFTSPGRRTLTVTAVDSAGASSSATLNLNVVNFAPVVTLSSPTPGTSVFRTAGLVLRGLATDRNEVNEQLPCDNLTWTSSVAGDPFPKLSCNVETVFSSNGPRTLTLTAKDAQGATDTKSVVINVIDPPTNLPPSVLVTSPEDNAVVGSPDDTLTLSGTATDPEGSSPLVYQWTVQLNDNPAIVVGNAANIQWKPSDTFNLNPAGTYIIKIRLNVTDPQGNLGTDVITLDFTRIG